MIVVVITGSRHWTDRAAMRRVLEGWPPGSVVIHGAQRGADRIAGEIAKSLGYEVEPYPAAWVPGDGGPERNARMIARLKEYRAQGRRCFVVAFPLPGGRGTRNCVRQAREAGFPILLPLWRRR